MSIEKNASSGPALDVTGLAVRYGGFQAVSGLDLNLPVGAVHGLIGPNGAGKTSSFNAICGYIPTSAGHVSVHGRRLSRLSPLRAWRSGIGRTFQRVELFWTLTVRDHLELARRRASRARRTAADPSVVLEWVGLTDIEHEVVASLPLGTCRLIELARALATGADVILLDEPCSGLDRTETARLQRTLEGLRAQLGLSLLIVEHDLDFILSIADRISVLDGGTLIEEGSPEEIQRSPAVRAAYLGEPSAAVPELCGQTP